MSAQSILDQALEIAPQVVAWRRDIHAHPELNFREFRTSRLVADTLREFGLEIETGVGKTGVVAHIGEGKPVIGIRADMDALPITEENTDLPYCSQNPGVMHACGHDAHTAMLLGVAKILSQMKERPAGEIRLLFQPSEEAEDSDNKSGAVRMIEDGALQGVDAVIALHTASTLTSGEIRIASGPALASVDSFYATIIGVGGHGAYPHQTVDPIFLAAQVINAIHGLRARRIKPISPAVLTVGAIHGGTATNIIPAEVELIGTIRSFDEDTRHQLWEELERAFSVARALGGDYKLRISKGYPSLYNDPAVAALIKEVGTELVGADKCLPDEPAMGAEDFAYMAQAAPGAMLGLGGKYDDQHRPHHSPIFNLNEDSFPYGVAILTETALRMLTHYA